MSTKISGLPLGASFTRRLSLEYLGVDLDHESVVAPGGTEKELRRGCLASAGISVRRRLPSGEHFSETNDNSVIILLIYGTTRVLLTGDAEAREEDYMAEGSYTNPLTVINIPELHTQSEPRFRALLIGGVLELEVALA